MDHFGEYLIGPPLFLKILNGITFLLFTFLQKTLRIWRFLAKAQLLYEGFFSEFFRSLPNRENLENFLNGKSLLLFIFSTSFFAFLDVSPQGETFFSKEF